MAAALVTEGFGRRFGRRTLLGLDEAEVRALSRRGEGVGRALAWLSGLGAGVGLMYLFDPVGGARRRGLLRDRARHVVNESEHAVARGVRDLSNRARGAVAEARSALQHAEASDAVVNERVRAKLGRVVSHPNAICTAVERGVVHLSGDIHEGEVLPLLRSLHMVPGVRGVANGLERHDDPAHLPALKGRRRRTGPRSELFHESWSPGARVAVGGMAGALLGWAALRGGLRGLGAGVLAAPLVARAITNRPLRGTVGRLVGQPRGGFQFSKTIHVRAPLEQVYAYFSDLRNFPRFMSHVKGIRVVGGRSHWEVEGPAGSTFSWDAEVTKREPNRLLAWRSLPGAEVENSGIARFERDGDGTRVQIRLSYSPPAGVLGHMIAHLFGKDPKQAMDDDLLRFKSLLELGKATGRGAQVRRDELAPSLGPDALPH